MDVGVKRTFIARIAAGLGLVCGVIGLSAGLTENAWRLGSIGWFTGGGLLLLIALFVLLDATLALRRTQVVVAQMRSEEHRFS